MNLKYDIKSIRSGLHIANSPTLHKNKKKLGKKKRKTKKKKKASQTDWLKSHCHLVSNGYLSNGFKVVIVFIGYNRLTFIQVYLQRSVVRVPDCGDVLLFSAVAGGCCR